VEGQPSDVEVDVWSRLRVPSARVAADVVDGEVVVINLDTGSYYSTDGAGCDAWVLLAAGASRTEVIDSLAERYEAADGEIATYIDALVDRLLAEGLMAPVTDDASNGVDEVRLPPIAGRVAFTPADFIGYDDMKGLLLLDPVHEVDDRGWPHAAAGG
jgi:hypothetical protein